VYRSDTGGRQPSKIGSGVYCLNRLKTSKQEYVFLLGLSWLFVKQVENSEVTTFWKLEKFYSAPKIAGRCPVMPAGKG
jgi:hypothetical protein